MAHLRIKVLKQIVQVILDNFEEAVCIMDWTELSKTVLLHMKHLNGFNTLFPVISQLCQKCITSTHFIPVGIML